MSKHSKEAAMTTPTPSPVVDPELAQRLVREQFRVIENGDLETA